MQSWLHQVSMHFKRFHSLNKMELEGIDGYLRTHYAAIRLVTTMTDINACIIIPDTATGIVFLTVVTHFVKAVY